MMIFSTLLAGHELAVDLQHDQLYCGACNAYMSDATFDSAVKVGFGAILAVAAAAVMYSDSRKWQNTQAEQECFK